MKKIVLIAAILALVYGTVYALAERDNPNSKIYDMKHFDRMDNDGDNKTIQNAFYGKNTYYLKGFDFDNYKSYDPSLSEITAAEINAIINGTHKDKVTQATGPYAIIGHSQGGLRALGYIRQLQDTYRDNPEYINNIDAVITISGTDQGLKMLNGGLGNFKSNASAKINILGNGMRALSTTFSITNLFGLIIPRNSAADAFNIFTHIIPSPLRPYWAHAWATTNPASVPQLGDMIPITSSYITHNVVKSVGYNYKVKTGSDLVSEWRSKKVLFVTVWYLLVGYVDRYAYYTKYEATPQFNNKVPLGFIVGTNSRTLSMADNEKQIKDILYAAEIAFAVSEGVHIAKCIGILGLFTGSKTYAQDANAAKKMMNNFEGALNDIKQSTENDGLVAVESQYIPQKFTNPNTNVTKTVMQNPVLGRTSYGYVNYNYNHINIEKIPIVFERAASMISEGLETRRSQGYR